MPSKTYPTKSAGPHFPVRPLSETLLRIIPGDPRHAAVPLQFLHDHSLPVYESTTLTLHATLGNLTAAILLPTLSPNPIPVQWFDFCLDDLSSSSSCLVLTLTTTDHDRAETSFVGRTVFVASDFSPRKGLLHRPLLDPAGLPVARLTLDFLVVTPAPVSAPDVSVRAGVPRFTGHRGVGSSGPTYPWRVMENIPESFLLAAMSDSPVKTVELDIQLSRDGRTIVYHDWFFRPDGSRDKDAKKSPVKIPLYNLTFDEFDQLFRSLYSKEGEDISENRRRLRDAVVGRDDVAEDVFDTRVWSLKDVCEALPKEIGLLVEVKYPAPNVQEKEIIPYPEKNLFIDIVLRDLFEVARNRKREISFLSFDPDLSTLLSLKQTLYPVYLSHCEALDKPCDEYDPRLIDLDEGLRFAVSQKLDGMMLLNQLVELKPDAIERIKARGLPIITYGKRNNDPEFVEQQFQLGIGGVIADDVNALVDTLRT